MKVQSENVPAKLLEDNLSKCFDVKENINSDFALHHFNKTRCFKSSRCNMNGDNYLNFKKRLTELT